jgi:hypothetical protein
MAGREWFDVVIVGGGPAGSACGSRLAQHGVRVGVVEASDFEPFRIGETIDGGVRPLLGRVGLKLDGESPWHMPGVGVGSAWGSTGVRMRPSIASPYGRGWRVDRRSFDRALLEHARTRGAEVFRRSRVVSAERQAGSWTLVIDTGTDTVVGRTPWVVEATGRAGRSPCSPRDARMWLDRLVGVAIRGDSAGRPTPRLDGAALVESVRCGWWYSVGLPSGEMLVVFFTDVDYLPRGRVEALRFLETQLSATEGTRERAHFVYEKRGLPSLTVFDARSSVRRVVKTEGWVAIGDALVASDPLYGRGVFDALSSGIEVADWLSGRPEEGGDAVPAWIAQASSRFNRYVIDRAMTYGRETRWADSAFWQRRRSSPKREVEGRDEGAEAPVMGEETGGRVR